MELHLPEIVRHLSSRPMLLLAEHGMRLIRANNHDRRDMLSEFRPLLHNAAKFIFDSGQDADAETTTAVKETSTAMVEDGRFHLPYPTTWIEDPFEENPFFRNYYLAKEWDGEIRVWVIARHPPLLFEPPPQHFTFCTTPLIINLDGRFDGHSIPVDHPPGTPGHDPQASHHLTKMLGEVDYTIRKFIVTLGAGGVEREEIITGRSATSRRAPRGSSHPYTVIRIPLLPVTGSDGLPTGRRRRRHFVRGFVWGKNTRPREEQRWVAGYYRGDAEEGEIKRTHYEVRA